MSERTIRPAEDGILQVRLFSTGDERFVMPAVRLSRTARGVNLRGASDTYRYLPPAHVSEEEETARVLKEMRTLDGVAALAILSFGEGEEVVAYAYATQNASPEDDFAFRVQLEGVCVAPGRQGFGFSAAAGSAALGHFSPHSRVVDRRGAFMLLLNHHFEGPDSVPPRDITPDLNNLTVESARRAIAAAFPDLPAHTTAWTGQLEQPGS